MCGEKLYILKDLMDKTLGDTPYLTIICSGLKIKDRNKKFKLQHSGLTMISILENEES